MSVRSLLMKLLEFITCLGSLASRYFAADTPSLTILQTAVIDLIYGSSRRRPGNFSCYFPFHYDSLKFLMALCHLLMTHLRLGLTTQHMLFLPQLTFFPVISLVFLLLMLTLLVLLLK